MTFAELLTKALTAFPDAKVHQDYWTGEITISTGLRETKDKQIVPMK